MTVARELAVYDGQRRVGTIIKRGDRFAAKDINGRRLGTFDSLKAAADAISRKDAAPHAQSSAKAS